jgi:DNA-binding transcriptional ArsR family regulator
MSALMTGNTKLAASQATIKVLKALANPTRLALIKDLARCPGGESCGKLSEKKMLSQPTMSHHFLKLLEAGVITERKFGTQKEYRLNKPLLESMGIDLKKL